jgi:tetratricopeptide (TPR) repeat protein
VPTLLAGLAAARLQGGDAAEAEKIARIGRQAAPDDPRFEYLLGRCAMVLGRPDEAAGHFEAALRANPRSVANLVELAGVAMAQERLGVAEEHLEQALAIDPRAQGARAYLAEIRLRQGRVDDAEAEVDQALVDWPDDARGVFAAARVKARRGDWVRCEELLRRAIDLEPRFVGARLELARMLLRQGRHYDEAIALTRGAVEFEPAGQDLSLAYFLLADLYNRTGRADLSASFAERGRQAEAERRN